MDGHDSRLSFGLSNRRLAHFLAVYDKGGMAAAARGLDVSQQALSKSIAALESFLDVPLFERTPLGVIPTFYAERLVERARNILAEAEIAASEIEALRGFRSGVVRLGSGPSLAARRVPKAIFELRRKLPDVGVGVTVHNTDQLLPLLLQGQLDFIVSAPIAGQEIDESLMVEPLGKEYDELVGRRDHPLRRLKDPHISDFAACTWIGEAASSHIIRRASGVFVKAGIAPFADVITTNSMDLIKSVILESDAVSLLHEELYADQFESGLIAPFDMAEFRMERDILMISRRNATLATPARRLMEILRRTIIDGTTR